MASTGVIWVSPRERIAFGAAVLAASFCWCRSLVRRIDRRSRRLQTAGVRRAFVSSASHRASAQRTREVPPGPAGPRRRSANSPRVGFERPRLHHDLRRAAGTAEQQYKERRHLFDPIGRPHDRSEQLQAAAEFRRLQLRLPRLLSSGTRQWRLRAIRSWHGQPSSRPLHRTARGPTAAHSESWWSRSSSTSSRRNGGNPECRPTSPTRAAS